VANLLAVTIGRMNTAQGGDFDAGEPDTEPVTLGPGTYFHMEDTSVSGQKDAPDGVWELRSCIHKGRKMW